MVLLKRRLIACRAGVFRWLRLPLLSGTVVLMTSPTADAHLVTSGAGPFYDGMAHFLVSPEDLLVVVALSLFGGLSGKQVAKGIAVVLPLAWLVGMLAGVGLPSGDGTGPILTAVTMGLSGLLLGVSPQASVRIMVPVVAIVGVVHGWLNGIAVADTGTSLLAGLGIVTAAAITGVLLSAAAVSVTASWQRIALRVAGSWIAAIGLLAFAWQSRPLD